MSYEHICSKVQDKEMQVYKTLRGPPEEYLSYKTLGLES
jgi:hypothetical protein